MYIYYYTCVITDQERTVFVELVRPPGGQSLTTNLTPDILTRALSRFGNIEKTELASSDRSGKPLLEI